MAITINGSLAIDESSGTQNAADAADSSGNDIAGGAGVLPSEFDAVLLQEGISSATATGVAVSGATADNSTGTDLLTNLGANITNLAFTDAAGNPLNGTAAMIGGGAFLLTTSGRKIWLYTSDFDDNVVIGRMDNGDGVNTAADESGQVVFAAYLDTHTAVAGDAGATGAKVWLVQYLPIQHGTAGSTAADYDDSRTLLDSLWVTVSTSSNFSLAGAPSGQNLFLIYGDADDGIAGNGIGDDKVAIVVTGKNPVNQSGADPNSTGDDIGISGGDTVNTGQGGGGTTIGSNNQMVDPNEGMYFTFVRGANPNFVVPNLDQNEADVEANIQFQAMFGTTAASFDVVQLQPSKAATLKISAFSTAYEPGTSYIDGLHNDTAVAVNFLRIVHHSKVGNKVAVNTYEFTASGTQGDITVTFTDGPLAGTGDTTMTIKGVAATDHIEYHTGATHNRVLIDNVGTANNFNSAFDIGGFGLVNATTESTAFSVLSFQDDGPSAAAADAGGAVTIDESAGNQNDDNDAAAVAALFAGVTGAGTDMSPAEFAISTTALASSTGSDYGKDGAGTTVLSLAIVGGDGTNSLLDTTDGKDILLFKEGDLIVGRYDTANGAVTAADPAAFAIALQQDGKVAVAQYVSLKHGPGGSTAAAYDDQVDLTGLVNAVVTITDGDGDTSTATVGIGNDINFDDDGPTAAATDEGGSVTVDETAGNQDDDSDAAAVAALFAGVAGGGTDLSPTEFAISSIALASSSGSSQGQDGAGSTTVALEIVGGDGTDSLLDTTDAKNILLFKEGDLIVGRYDTANGAVTAADPAAFAIAMQQDGKVAVAQYVSLKHGPGGSTAAAYDDQVDLSGLVNAVVTVTDGDGDIATASVGIGNDINFDDDGPTAAANDEGGSVTVDETAGNQDDDSDAATVAALFAGVSGAGTDLSPAEFAISTSALASSTGSAFGQDGAGTTAMSLAIVGGNGTDSALDTTDGKNILLFKEGGLIVGRYDTANGAVTAADPAAFAIVLEQDGRVAVAQYVSLKHGPGGSTAAAYDDQVDLSGLVNVVTTVTDGDGDTATASVGIGNDINFDDDGPSVAFGNLIGTGTTAAQTGFWTMAPGNDGLGATALDIALTTFTLVRPNNDTAAGTFTFDELADSGAGGTYLFGGRLTGDFDNNADTDNTSVDFTLTAFADGHYTLDLVQGFASTIVLSSADGSLDAGGPDPVRTLTIGTEQIVFFAANPLASQKIGDTATNDDSIQDGIVVGVADKTEAQLQTSPLPSYIGSSSMNVSTSGIGVANNVFQGNTTAGFQADDESFVVNPLSQITAMKVFIDNSVAGYNTATEDLFYRIYYVDGSVGPTTEVNTPALTAETGGQVSFLVQREGTKMIDAVQLLMGRGDIKIPVIQFITESVSLASDLKLDFNATVTDGDGDSATDAFSTVLNANEVNAAFDFMLAGTASVQDAFNIDLVSTKNGYQVSGFDTGTLRDKLVLLGPAPTSVSINNSNTDSVVTIVEAGGGQTTTVTVVGVDLLNTDIA